ncbi:MAG TPA: PilZ domain-containing protein [Candidatus Acidoferrales bacterium]|nr:PilZ domain-containing protein [Candidatus Acidoferrales bacterium]
MKRQPSMPQEFKKSPNSVESSEQERRRSIRYPFTATAYVTDIESRAQTTSRSTDLGRGGCFVDTINPFPVGTTVMLRLTMEQKSFEAPAKVVYSMIGMGMGLAFTSIEPEQLWVLESWLGKLSGVTVPDRQPVAAPLDESPPPQNANPEHGYVLNELIITLMRKRMLTEEEGKALLKKLMN